MTRTLRHGKDIRVSGSDTWEGSVASVAIRSLVSTCRPSPPYALRKDDKIPRMQNISPSRISGNLQLRAATGELAELDSGLL